MIMKKFVHIVGNEIHTVMDVNVGAKINFAQILVTEGGEVAQSVISEVDFLVLTGKSPGSSLEVAITDSGMADKRAAELIGL